MKASKSNAAVFKGNRSTCERRCFLTYHPRDESPFGGHDAWPAAAHQQSVERYQAHAGQVDQPKRQGRARAAGAQADLLAADQEPAAVGLRNPLRKAERAG